MDYKNRASTGIRYADANLFHVKELKTGFLMLFVYGALYSGRSLHPNFRGIDFVISPSTMINAILFAVYGSFG